jgi:hypothetical protein
LRGWYHDKYIYMKYKFTNEKKEILKFKCRTRHLHGALPTAFTHSLPLRAITHGQTPCLKVSSRPRDQQVELLPSVRWWQDLKLSVHYFFLCWGTTENAFMPAVRQQGALGWQIALFLAARICCTMVLFWGFLSIFISVTFFVSLVWKECYSVVICTQFYWSAFRWPYVSGLNVQGEDSPRWRLLVWRRSQLCEPLSLEFLSWAPSRPQPNPWGS